MPCALVLTAHLLLAGAAPWYADKRHLLCWLDAAGERREVRTLADWAHRREHILLAMQAVMGPLPGAARRVPLEPRLEQEERLGNVIRRKLTFASEAGDRVPAYLLLPDDHPGRRPAVLCLHQTTGLGKGEPAGVGGLANLHYALELAQRGYVTLAPDYPRFGDYPIDAYHLGYDSATMKGIWNHMRALDLLATLPEVDGDRLGCLGHSLGGHNTLFLAAFDPRVRVAVTSCGFTAFAKYYGGDLTGWSSAAYMPRIASVYGRDPARMPFDFSEVLAAIAPRAIFVNAPTGDSNFEASGVRDCLDAARPVYRLFGAADQLVAQHPECGHDFPPAVRAAAYAAIDRTLGHQPVTTRP